MNIPFDLNNYGETQTRFGVGLGGGGLGSRVIPRVKEVIGKFCSLSGKNCRKLHIKPKKML